MDLSDRALYELDGVGPLSIEVVEFLTSLVLAHQERLPGHQRKVLTPMRDQLIANLFGLLRREYPDEPVSHTLRRITEAAGKRPHSFGPPGEPTVNDTAALLWAIRSAAPVPNHRRIRQILEQEGVQ